ncbi:winged helix-turn-helix transcriptional regulator [Curtobacterium flaccumfaciens]|uniref:winged helix-turn-helix transcriptional regulator n=1 Tax=Curtobacterium flaccumfaciens TaxID=2035 RepID=UPI0027DF0194|nr:helix-turn-helix domain-containing protein [Curtobacterium allii]
MSPYKAGCATRSVLDRVGDRWTVLIVGVLGGGELRFSDLKRSVQGVSQKMLSQTLRALERDGLVRRTVFPEVPVRVEYALTESGRTLLEPLHALQRWSIDNVATVTASQEAYDRTHTATTTGAAVAPLSR